MKSNILGQRLKLLRQEAGLTQEEFGKPYNLRKSTISQYESGDSRPDDELKKQIALDYNVSLDWLMGISDIRNYLDNSNVTIALHSDETSLDYSDLSDEAKKEVQDFIEYVRHKYKDK